MNILFIAPYVPSRIRVRPFHLICELARWHNVHVLALGEPGGDTVSGVDDLARVVEEFRIIPHSKLRGYSQCLASLPGSAPMCTAFCQSPAMQEAVARMLSHRRFDVVHIEHLRAAHFTPKLDRVPVVFDSVDFLTGLFSQMSRRKKNPLSRLVALEESWKLRRYEPRALKWFDRVVITSEPDRKALLELDGSLDVDVVPNGVDTAYFCPDGSASAPARIMFSGKMSYAPNAQAALWFAEQVFPEVRERRPDAEFMVVGSDPPASLQKLDGVGGVTVTGYVDDMRPYLRGSALAVAPMEMAAGVQNKVLEAMSAGLPVVVSPLAARTAEGCDSMNVAQQPDEWVREVVSLLDSPGRIADLGRRNRAWVVANSSWQASAAMLERIYVEAIARRMI